MGTTVYMKLGQIQGLPYKTTVLAGRLDLGANGIAIFGAVWVLPAIGFVLCGVGLLAGWAWWQPVLLAVTLVSAVLTVLDWQVAYAGAIVNLVILTAALLGPRVATWFG